MSYTRVSASYLLRRRTSGSASLSEWRVRCEEQDSISWYRTKSTTHLKILCEGGWDGRVPI